MDDFRRKNIAVTNNRSLLLGTVTLLVVAFFILIALVFVFSLLSPALLGKCVAVVEIKNSLSTDGVPSTIFSEGEPSSEELANTIYSLNKREDVASVLFVINSPGGSAVASREIYESIEKLNKPKVAYIKEVGASGGYHIASASDYIYASPDAMTGSIGSIVMFSSLSGLFDKVGVGSYAVKSGNMKDIGSPFRNATTEELAVLQSMVNESFYYLKTDIIKHRSSKLNTKLFEEILDGRVMSGRQAVQVGLVDKTGNKNDALVKAAELGNLSYSDADSVRVCQIKVATGESSSLLFGFDSMLKSINNKLSGIPNLLFQ